MKEEMVYPELRYLEKENKATKRGNKMKYIIVDIGRLECDVPSDIVGIFDDKEKANKIVTEFNKIFGWRDGGQHEFEVFKMPKLNVVNAKYSDVVANVS